MGCALCSRCGAWHRTEPTTHTTHGQAGKTIEVPKYDFTVHKRLPESQRVEPPDVILIDGIFALAVPEVRYASTSAPRVAMHIDTHTHAPFLDTGMSWHVSGIDVTCASLRWRTQMCALRGV